MNQNPAVEGANGAASDSAALHTDRYELGNLQAASRSGVASRLAVLLRHSVEEAREYHLAARARLRPEHLSIQAGPPALVASAYQPAVEAGR